MGALNLSCERLSKKNTTSDFDFLYEDQTQSLEISRDKFKELLPNEVDRGFAFPYQGQAGDKVDFYFMLREQQEILQIVRLYPEPREVVAEIKANKADNKCSQCSYNKGCNWHSVASIEISRFWKSGVYTAARRNEKSMKPFGAPFIVYDKNPADVLFVFDWNTINSYNVYAGASPYVYMLKDRVYTMGDFPNKKTTPTEFSLKRPQANFHYNGNEFRQKNFDFTLSWLTLFSKEKTTASVVTNTKFGDLSLAQIQKHKVIILSAVQEYVSKKFIDMLEQYILQGGFVVILGNEFSFRTIRFSENESFYFFPHLSTDPMLNTDKEQVASDLAPHRDIENFFGASIKYARAFISRNKEGYPLQFVNKKHPLLKGINLNSSKDFGFVKDWSLGAVLKKNTLGVWCTELMSGRCLPVDLLGFAEMSTEGQFLECCSSHAEIELKNYGKIIRTPTTIPEKIYAPLMIVRQGKGKILIIPHRTFEPQFPFTKIFWRNIKELSLNQKIH